MRPPTTFCERKPRMRCFSIESWMQILQNNAAMMICLSPQCLSSEWRTTCDQKSRPLIYWPNGVRWQKGSYRITLLGVSNNLPPSQTTSIMISMSVISTMQNTFSTTQYQSQWPLSNVMSKQFIWFLALVPHGGETISHQDMIQCFSGWGRVWIATLSQLLDVFPHGWSVFPLSRMLNRALHGFLHSFWHFQQGQYVTLLVWWLSRTGINLRCNPCTMEATIVSLISASGQLISCLYARSKELYSFFPWRRGQIDHQQNVKWFWSHNSTTKLSWIATLIIREGARSSWTGRTQHDVLLRGSESTFRCSSTLLKKRNRIQEYSEEYEVVFGMLYNHAFKLVYFRSCWDYDTGLQHNSSAPGARLSGSGNI